MPWWRATHYCGGVIATMRLHGTATTTAAVKTASSPWSATTVWHSQQLAWLIADALLAHPTAGARAFSRCGSKTSVGAHVQPSC